MAKKTVADKAPRDSARGNGGGDEIALPAGVGTQQDVPAFGPNPTPREADRAIEPDEPVEDTKRLRRDKAVWGEGATATSNELLRDAQEVDRVAAANAETD